MVSAYLCRYDLGDSDLTNHLVKCLQDKVKPWRVGALRVRNGCMVHVNNAHMAYYVDVMVYIKSISLNKHYSYQNKIYYLDKIYFCFAKIHKAFQTYSVYTKLVTRLVKKYRIYPT